MQAQTVKLKKKAGLPRMGTAPLQLHQSKRRSAWLPRPSSFTSSSESTGLRTPKTICAFVKAQVVPLLDGRTLTCAG